jgi:hypothetical protein
MDGVFDTATGFYSTSFAWAIQNQKTDSRDGKTMLDEAAGKRTRDGIRYKNNRRSKPFFWFIRSSRIGRHLATAMQAQLREIGFALKSGRLTTSIAAMKNTTIGAWQ